MYQVKYTKNAIKELSKLDGNTRKILLNWIGKNLVHCEDPCKISQYKKLKGDKNENIRYRVGNYRIICFVKDNELIIKVIKIGHKKEVYK